MPILRSSFLPLVVLILAVSGGDLFAQKKVKDPVKVTSVRPEVLRSRLVLDPTLTLRDDEGREVEATLLSAHGEIVKIQRMDDEREFDVPISSFDSETEDLIRNWIDRDPEAVEFSLELSASRELVKSSSFDMAGRSFKTSEWSYRVTLANQTRNELKDAEIEYRIVFDDNVVFSRTSAMPGKGANQQDGQSIDLPDMQFNDEIEFDTPVIETQTYEYKPTRGDRDYAKDEIKGIWIRVIKHGEVICEYKSNEAAMGSLSWDNEDEVEITITNRFRDSFEDDSE